MHWRAPITLSIAGIIALLVIGASAYFGLNRSATNRAASQSSPLAEVTATQPPAQPPTPPTNYTSSTVGITLTHPADWHPHDVETPSGITTVFLSAPIDNPDPQTIVEGQVLAFTVWREEHRGESIEEWAIRTLSTPYGFGPAQREYLTVADQLALRLEFLDEPVSMTVVNVGQFRYVLQADVVAGTYREHADLFNQVITSMQVTP